MKVAERRTSVCRDRLPMCNILNLSVKLQMKTNTGNHCCLLNHLTNRLPSTNSIGLLLSLISLTVFRKRLKTHLFNCFFPQSFQTLIDHITYFITYIICAFKEMIAGCGVLVGWQFSSHMLVLRDTHWSHLL